ncbi:metallo-dependent hydrolases superfamily Peptidase M19 family, partial [Rhizoctonia solani]
MNHTSSSERTPLLTTVIQNSNPNSQAAQQASSSVETGGDHHGHAAAYNPRVAISSILALLFSLGLVIFGVFYIERLPNDPERAAIKILEKTPLIDGHIDLPIMVRMEYRNNISRFDMNKAMKYHVDIPRLRQGKVGGYFWSVFVECADSGPDFLTPTNRVRDTLEQIDVSTLLIEKYADTFALATSVKEIEQATRVRKIASLIGVEGAHQLGNSLAVLRQYYRLGARYMTLTHSCNNAFADSAGIFEPVPATHGGLSPLGKELIQEMNRIGMLVDLSHTSDDTAVQAIRLSRAPVMWSHSSVRALRGISRNVPDHILEMIGIGKGQRDGVVMVNLYPRFLVEDGGNATLYTVADHIEHIAKVAGRAHVGIGSDFDGIEIVPDGLEDVSKYPALFAELLRRGWSRAELEGLASRNFLRVFRGVEEVSREMQGRISPSMMLYDKRDPTD